MLVHVDEQKCLAQSAPGQQLELVEARALFGAAAFQHLLPVRNGVAQFPQRTLVRAKFVQRMPGRAQARQKQLVFTGAMRQGGHAAGNGGGVGAGATDANGFVDLRRKGTQAVPQLARVFIGHAFAQKAADVAKRLKGQQLTGARGRHSAADCAPPPARCKR
ncbi:hypothetical protein D3C71_1581140 [compost metagenome]